MSTEHSEHLKAMGCPAEAIQDAMAPGFNSAGFFSFVEYVKGLVERARDNPALIPEIRTVLQLLAVAFPQYAALIAWVLTLLPA